jgi:hypothetical protein
MANRTITGCYSAGSVVFQGEACDSGDYTGCYVSSGEHDGMIAVTILENNCDDTYYACFDSGTGKFNLSIPDDCCNFGTPCNLCSVPSQTPKTISVTFSGISLCGCIKGWYSNNYFTYEVDFDINNTFMVQQVANSPCIWQANIGNNIYKEYHYSDCSGTPTRVQPGLVIVTVTKYSSAMRVNMHNSYGIGSYFNAYDWSDHSCLEGNISSDWTECVSTEDYLACGTGGSANW